MIRLEKALIRLNTDLRALGIKWALVGGLAVSIRAEPRTTRDLDVAIAVSGDPEAEGIARSLTMRGYQPFPDQPFLENHEGRLNTVRLLVPGWEDDEEAVITDLLFGSSGVEEEIVAAAEMRAVLPGVYMRVATIGHLIALKVLAGRGKDQTDARALLLKANFDELQRARDTLDLIERRGFHRNKDLMAELARLLEPEE